MYFLGSTTVTIRKAFDISHSRAAGKKERYKLFISFYELEYRFNVYSDYELAETFARDIRGRHNSILHTK